MGSVEFTQQIGQRNVSLRAKLLSMYVSKSNMMAMAILIISAKQKHISMLPSMHTGYLFCINASTGSPQKYLYHPRLMIVLTLVCNR